MLKVEFLDHEITFDELTEMWSTLSGDIKNKSLKAVKAALSKRDADTRRIGTVPAFEIGWAKVQPCELTLLAEDKRWVWIRKNGDRSKVSLESVILDTPDNRRDINEATALLKSSAELNARAAAILKAIPRPTLAELMARENIDAE